MFRLRSALAAALVLASAGLAAGIGAAAPQHLAPDAATKPQRVAAAAAAPHVAEAAVPEAALLPQFQSALRSAVEAIKPHGEAAQGMHAPWYAFPSTFGLICCVIVCIYGNRGWKVVASVLMYLTALSTMKLAVKWVFVEYAFKFPKFVTVLHFVSGGLVCLGVQLYRTQGRIAVPTWSEFLFMVTPISVASSVSIGACNMALGFSSVAFTEIVGATGCLFTVATVLLMGLPFDMMLTIPCAAVAMGCALSTAGEVSFSVLGLVLVFTSNFFRSAKATLQQKLMTGESKEKFDPCTLLMWVSVPSVVMMLAGSVISEGLGPYKSMAKMDSATFWGLWAAIGVSCVNAVVLNLAQLFVTKDLGAVGGQLVSQAKSVLTVLGSMALFGESVTRLELVGFAEVLMGVYAYSALETRGKQQREAAAKQAAKEAAVAPPEAAKPEAAQPEAAQPEAEAAQPEAEAAQPEAVKA